MTLEKDLIRKWHSLPREKQQQVIDFMDFLYWQEVPSASVLKDRFQQIRTKITNYGNHSYTNPRIRTSN